MAHNGPSRLRSTTFKIHFAMLEWSHVSSLYTKNMRAGYIIHSLLACLRLVVVIGLYVWLSVFPECHDVTVYWYQCVQHKFVASWYTCLHAALAISICHTLLQYCVCRSSLVCINTIPSTISIYAHIYYIGTYKQTK